ncbi:MAG: NADH-quinone oxidoreductase subunit L [Nitrososphaerota archaeon]|nr:NADH-quinone oxidoreductase subunit L [Candidatus Calditenuaceae archaeon]MDW8073770.1 NADH-quinone oxidoreductase subunit L [Nitrososphaerota archaeon]
MGVWLGMNMEIQALSPLILSIALPLGFSPIAAFFGRLIHPRSAGIFATTVLFFPMLFSLLLFPAISGGGVVEERFSWIPELGLTFTLRLDQLSYPFYLLITLVGFLSTLYSLRYMEHERGLGSYYALTMMFVAGMTGVVLATNLFLFYIFWELMLIPSYFLIAYWGSGNARVIGFKYFGMTHVGAIALLAGIIWLNSLYGSVELDILRLVLGGGSPAMLGIATLIFIGAAVKMALFPLHTWLPDAHAEAPTPISVLLSGVMIKTGVYAYARILGELMPAAFQQALPIVTPLALVTVFWGGMMALVQRDIKRILAYSSISQIGYMVFGLSLQSTIGLAGGLLHVFTHGLAKSLLFMAAGSIMHSTGERDIEKLGGLMRPMWFTASVFLIGGLSIAGTPPLAGFFSEWMIFAGGFQSNLPIYTIIAILGTALTLGYYLKAFMYIFTRGEAGGQVKEAPLSMALPMAVLAAAILLAAIVTPPITGILNMALTG